MNANAKREKSDSNEASVRDISRSELGAIAGVLPIVGVLCLIIFFAVFLLKLGKHDGDFLTSMSYSWLFGFYVFFTLALGGAFWTLLHHATNSSWGIVTRRVMEKLASKFALLALLAVPLLIPQVRDTLWKWLPEREAQLVKNEEFAKKIKSKIQNKSAKNEIATFLAIDSEKFTKDSHWGKNAELALKVGQRRVREESYLGKSATETRELLLSPKALLKVADEHIGGILHKKRFYLSKIFFLARFVLYFALMYFLTRYLLAKSVETDEEGGDKRAKALRKWSFPLLAVFALCITFSAIDWIMGLDYLWFSTMWGVYIFAGSAQASLCVIILTLKWLQSKGKLKGIVNEEHFHILGKLLHSFVIFWAYIAFSQYFLIWYANITEETRWFLIRNAESWRFYSMFLFFGRFGIPFVFLLPAWAKRRPEILSIWAAWLLLCHIIDLYWNIMPARTLSLHLESVGLTHCLMDLLAFLACGAIFVGFYLKSFAKHSLYPHRDPRLQESLHLLN